MPLPQMLAFLTNPAFWKAAGTVLSGFPIGEKGGDILGTLRGNAPRGSREEEQGEGIEGLIRPREKQTSSFQNLLGFPSMQSRTNPFNEDILNKVYQNIRRGY